MQFSSRMPIAVHILLCIAEFDGKYKTTSTFLAGSLGVNPVIVRNTLSKLKAAGLVRIESGVGGASLLKKPEDISLWEVFSAVEDAHSLFRYHDNPNPQCPVGRGIHKVLDKHLQSVNDTFKEQLQNICLQSLLDSLGS
ncbi:Rrf2 family transcriptional regulator [bacterium]|nr:Rrf2 family transcriptional regulator [bacterium]